MRRDVLSYEPKNCMTEKERRKLRDNPTLNIDQEWWTGLNPRKEIPGNNIYPKESEKWEAEEMMVFECECWTWKVKARRGRRKRMFWGVGGGNCCPPTDDQLLQHSFFIFSVLCMFQLFFGGKKQTHEQAVILITITKWTVNHLLFGYFKVNCNCLTPIFLLDVQHEDSSSKTQKLLLPSPSVISPLEHQDLKVEVTSVIVVHSSFSTHVKLVRNGRSTFPLSLSITKHFNDQLFRKSSLFNFSSSFISALFIFSISPFPLKREAL